MEAPTLETFGRRPRDALMWLPRAADVAAIAEVCRSVGPRVVDVGAGTGLLARLLLDEGVEVEAVDPAPPAVQYVPVERRAADELRGGYDVAIVARLAPVVVNAYDKEGGCGVLGAVDFAPLGFTTASWWETPSFEDVEFALDRPGRGLRRNGFPGNRIDVLTQYKALAPALKETVASAQAGPAYEWETEAARLGLDA